MHPARKLLATSAIAVFAAAGASIAVGCAGATAPAPGQVMLVLETDGGEGTPLDFDRVAVVVTDERASGQLVRSYDVTPARLPGTVALVADGAGGATTKVEVFATDARGVLRVYQAARVAIPTEGARMLRVKLAVACDGVVPKVACPGGAATCADAPRLACQSDRSCLAGRCVPVQEFGPRDLPAYEASRVEACEPETDAAICARRGIACGSFVLADSCGTPRVVRCGACAGEETATSAPSAAPECGTLGVDNCARSLLVTGGSFFRGQDESLPATISDLRLDKYEVTVGRFRRFVDAWIGGWRPEPGSGKHAHLSGGAGLATTTGGSEAGWDSAWTAYVGAPSRSGPAPSAPGATTKADWEAVLACSSAYQTWTSAPGPNETRPQNCLSWYDAYAFCIWDGGFLPSEAEWEYAAAGGDEERTYPWGSAVPAANASLAIYGRYYDGAGSAAGAGSVAPVGTVAAGAGRWGQLDLAGNVWEWTLDWFKDPLSTPCRDCTHQAPGSSRVIRGGSFAFDAAELTAAGRDFFFPALRSYDYGGRCARRP